MFTGCHISGLKLDAMVEKGMKSALFLALIYLLVLAPIPRASAEPRSITVAPDASIAYTDCDPQSRRCEIVRYSLQTSSGPRYVPPKGYGLFDASFDPKGERLLTLLRREDGSDYTAIGMIEGGRLRLMTTDGGLKFGPRLSEDGRYLLFLRAERKLRGRTRLGDFDLYELDLATQQEVRLTNLQLYRIVAPDYFGKDRSVIFGASGRGLDGSSKLVDKTYVLRRSTGELEEFGVSRNNGYLQQVTGKGDILFLDGVRPIKRLTVYSRELVQRKQLLRSNYIRDAGVDRDGKRVIYLEQDPSGRGRPSIVLWDTEADTLREIVPDEKRITPVQLTIEEGRK